MKRNISHPALKAILEKYFYGYPSEDTSSLYSALSEKELSEEFIESAAIRTLRYAEVIQVLTNNTSSKSDILAYGMFTFYDIRTGKELNESVIDILKQKEIKYLSDLSDANATYRQVSSFQPRNFISKLNEFFLLD